MQKTKGISLIVLVITIIVMIILAGAIILTLNNNGIIGKASEAVKQTDKATLEEIASLAWAEVYAENAASNNKLTGDKLLGALKQGIEAALIENKLKPDEYGITVTEKGFKIAKGWLQDGLIVTKGDKTLNIGDYIQYDETKDENGNTIAIDGVDVDWQVLGASDDGELLLLSTDNIIENYELGSKTDLKKAQNDWLNVDLILAGVCKSYGKGKNATGARTIRLEDIQKLPEYNPNTDPNIGEAGTSNEYGKNVSVYYNGTYEPDCIVTNGVKYKMEEHKNGFHYYNGNEFLVADFSKSSGLIVNLRNTSYARFVDINLSVPHLEMLFGKGKKYWLSNSGVQCFGTLEYDIMYVHIEEDFPTMMLECKIWNSKGKINSESNGVRAVVSLSADTTINENKVDNKWTY